ncbi:MAG: hypothetical protein GX362_03025 [Methanosarcinaceae archaeon]|nr:hypothetical protein [Methanosarcinaceae archaeon]
MSLNDSIVDIAAKVDDLLEPYSSHGKKNALVAAVLGLFFPGTGHMYIWETVKGVKLFLLWICLIFILIIFSILLTIITIAIPFLGIITIFIPLLFPLIFIVLAIYSAYDAYKLTNEYNERGNFE